MKKVLILLLCLTVLIHINTKAQCPPGAFAYLSPYTTCPSRCSVLLIGWPSGSVVNIYGGSPLTSISSVPIPGPLGDGGTGDAYTCVPCNIPLVFASTSTNSTSGCVITTIGIVPVKITNFSAATNAGKATIKWATSLESGPIKYVIQKSNNGSDYKDIATLNGSQLPQANNYTYIDQAINSITNYYRIKVLEISGNIFYSETALVKNKNSVGLSIYPNPAEQEFKISLPGKFLPAVVEIINAQGKSLYSEKINQATSIINKMLPKGIYAVIVTGSDATTVTGRLIRN